MTLRQLIIMLYNKYLYRFKRKKKVEEQMRTHIKDMLKKGRMSEIGGRLRTKQMLGKMKHERKTKQL